MSPVRGREDRSRWTKAYARRLLATDALVLVWSYVAMHLVWWAYEGFTDHSDALSGWWLAVSAGLVVIWLIALAVADTHDPRIVGSGPEEYKRIATATLFVFGFIALVVYGLGIVVPRPYVLIALPIGLTLLTASRWTWRQWLIYQRGHGRFIDDVLVVGSARSVSHLIETVQTFWHSGYRVIGACIDESPEGTWINGVPVIGGVAEVSRLAHESNVHGVVVASSAQSHPEMMRELGWALQDLDIDLIVAPALTNIAGPRLHVRPVAGVPLLHVEPPTYQGAQYWQKTLLDRMGSFVLVVVLSPVILAVGLLVTLTSKGPAFYVQERVGVDGKTFGMLKFRSMVDGAHALRAALAADRGNEMLFKMADDPRVTKVGKVLRRFSLDEIPQLFNVLKGDMSLVGPRPPLPEEVARYGTDAARRLVVRPGITGPWQVSGRSDLDWEETVRLDLYYVENWSLVGDLLLLAKTVRAVLSKKGAY
jgi:exopolysaccharide biosynthesis polyprenyl glycosylphosphotransferase